MAGIDESIRERGQFSPKVDTDRITTKGRTVHGLSRLPSPKLGRQGRRPYCDPGRTGLRAGHSLLKNSHVFEVSSE